MFDKILKAFADAVAAAVAREVAKQLPTIGEKVAAAVADRVIEKLPDFSGVDDLLNTIPNIGQHVVDEMLKRLPRIPFFN